MIFKPGSIVRKCQIFSVILYMPCSYFHVLQSHSSLRHSGTCSHIQRHIAGSKQRKIRNVVSGSFNHTKVMKISAYMCVLKSHKNTSNSWCCLNVFQTLQPGPHILWSDKLLFSTNVSKCSWNSFIVCLGVSQRFWLLLVRGRKTTWQLNEQLCFAKLVL